MASEIAKERFFKFRLPLQPGGDFDAQRTAFCKTAEACGYEVKIVEIDFVVIRIRKKSNQWTQGYVKAHRKWIDLVGPEALEIGKLLTTGEVPYEEA